MGSTFSGIEIAKRSLFSQQTALQTTGHNIANANTTGYTRQVVNLVASRPMEAVGLMRSNTPGQIGTGVEFDSIKRIRESFLDKQYYSENQDYGDWGVRKDTLDKLQAITNEPSNTSVRTVIENFWNAWQTLSQEPDNTTARAALKESALAMTDSFNHVSKQLSDLHNDITENIGVKVNDVNSALGQIARLNDQIFRVEGLGDNANDLRDQRDLLVDNLSKTINITVNDAPGGYSVKMGNVSLVTGATVDTTFSDKANPSATGGLTFEDALASGDLKSGEVYGMIYSRDTYLSSYQFQMDSMVKSIAEGDITFTMPKGSVLPPQLPPGTVLNGKTYDGTETLADTDRVLTADTQITVKGLNGIHMLGYSLDNPPQSGIPFFTKPDATADFSAANVSVNNAIVSDVGKIASSARVLTDASNNIVRDANGNETLVKGNNTIALAAADISNTRFDFSPSATGGTPLLKNGTIDEFFRAIAGQLGVQAQEADRQNTNQKALVDQVDSSRQSVSGVSTDEEMANMIKYQHAYDAAARILTTFDQMLDKVINSMGLVGR